MKKIFSLFFIVFFTFSANTQAEEVFNFTSFYPTPAGKYQTIRLNPQSALPTSNCNLGTIYSNADDNSLPYYCGPTVGLPAFAPIAGPWTLSSADLYLTDTSTPENKKVGIGTTSPIFKLTVDNDGGILADGLASTSSDLPAAVSGGGTRLMWYPKKGAFRAGGVDGTQWDNTNIGTNSVSMGYNTVAQQQGSSVWGGENNSATIIAGPGGSFTKGAVITGGKNNSTTSELSQILGGSDNTAGVGARVFGKNNTANGAYSTIGGGENNSATGSYSTIAGGSTNNAYTTADTISGGKQNEIWDIYNTITGGTANVIDQGSVYSTIAGGQNNNTGSGDYAVISGGKSNTASGNYSTISGGDTNTASGTYNTISGGNNNIANSTGNGASAIGGGINNTANGNYSIIVGGSSNTANEQYAIVVGGQNNSAGGSYSLAAGKFMNVTGDHTFVWGYSNAAIAPITANNAMIIYSGSVGIRDTNPAAKLEINRNNNVDQDYLQMTSSSGATSGNIFKINTDGYIGVNQPWPAHPLQFGNGAYVSTAGNFVNASSRQYKKNIIPLKISDALGVFENLTPVEYNYTNEADHLYLGFIAEDVPDLIANQNHDGLSPMDITALLTKVIRHQQDILKEQKNETDKLLKEFEELKNKAQIRNQSKTRLKSL